MNIALIPAKGFSRRIPGKNLINFCGRPLVEWSIGQAMDSNLIDQVWVSTDSPDVVSIVAATGCGYIERPSSLCTDTTTQEEVIAHAIETLNLKDDDNIVLLQPTSPLRLPGDIDRCIEFEGMSVIVHKDQYLWSVLNKHPLNFYPTTRERFAKETYEENGSIYCKNVGKFKRDNSRYGNFKTYHSFVIQKKWQQFEIDEPEDIEVVEYFMKKYILKEG